jgi:hypothetical protein
MTPSPKTLSNCQLSTKCARTKGDAAACAAACVAYAVMVSCHIRHREGTVLALADTLVLALFGMPACILACILVGVVIACQLRASSLLLLAWPPLVCVVCRGTRHSVLSHLQRRRVHVPCQPKYHLTESEFELSCACGGESETLSECHHDDGFRLLFCCLLALRR